MSFKAEKGCFLKDGKPYFLISGEIHYFRLNPKLWEKHLRLLKESGANTTSTYIPWDWHEYEEGNFDFSGKTNSARNLLRYIELCKKIGLDLIVKPGPYILAEYENQGLPNWLSEKCSKNAFVLDENKNIISTDLFSYMSEEFLSYVYKWYEKIMPIIAENQECNNGPIIMMQVCNEVGVFQWLSGNIDYNPSVIKLYKKFLLEKYVSINNLNNVYGTKYSSIEKILPPIGKIENKTEYRAYYDFHLFFRHYFSMYIDTLINKIRSFKIEIQLSHNIPGWIYGNASELPMLISTYSEIFNNRTDIVFGLDHIPEFISFRNAHSDLACNKFLEALQQNGPVWAAEFQAGTREHQVKSDANDLIAFYYASIAHGLKGFNYYMFSQGINPNEKGYFGKTFYYQTPVDNKGSTSALYNVVKEINHFIKREKENLILSYTKSDISIGLYKPYFYSELINSQLLKEKKLNVSKLGLNYDSRFVREEMLFNGLLRILQTLNFNYDIRELDNTSVEDLLKYKQMWMLTTDFMDKETQSKLVHYVKKGGHLIIYPTLPYLDEYLNPCTILKDEFNISVSKRIGVNKINAFGIEDLYTLSPEKEIYEANDNEAVATTKLGEICGIRGRIEQGSVTLFGFGISYTTDEHLTFIKKIVSLNNIRKEINISDPDIQFVVRRGKSYDYLFLLNYHNSNKKVSVDGKVINLNPFSCKVIKQKKLKSLKVLPND